MTDTNKNGDSGGPHFDEEMSERYLFGELSEAEQERFETAYFGDDAFFERFLAVKTELLDLYSRGELDPETRERMEPHFLATAPRRQKIAESGDFIRAVTAVSARAATAGGKTVAVTDSPGWIDSIAHFFTLPRLAGAGLLVAVLGAAWLFLRSDGSGVEQAVQQPSQAVSAPANRELEVASDAKDSNTPNETAAETPAPETAPPAKQGQKQFAAPRRVKANPAFTADNRIPKKKEASSDRPINERAATGFALTLSTVGRDRVKPVGPAPTSGLDIGGQRAQVELTGKVVDPNGEFVAGAAVSARNMRTGLIRSVTTAADGSYQITELPAGKYDITAEAATLMKTRIPPLTLTAQRSELQIKMDSGAAVVSVAGTESTGRTQDITLESLGSRDVSEKNTISLRPTTRRIGVWLAFDGGPYGQLSARVATVDGTGVWRQRNLKVTSHKEEQEKYVRLFIPARLLRRKDYIVTLEARTASGQTETIREYYFHVDRPRPDRLEAERDRPMKP